MSRVQKGGLVFKPVAKARPRATSTAPKPASTSAADTPASTAPQLSSAQSEDSNGSLGDPVPSSMPPPATLPSSNVPSTSQPVASTSRAPPTLIPSGSRIAAPPLIKSRTPAPAVIISRPATTPNSTLVNNESGPLSTLTSTQATIVPTPPNPAKKKPARARATADTEGEATDAESVKPKKGKKAPARKKKAAEAENATEEAPKKAKRKRVTKKAAETEGDATENDDAPEQSKRPKRKRAKTVIIDDEETEGDDGDDTPKPKRSKRKRAAKKDGATDDDDEVVRPRRKRKPKVPDFDPDADPGEELDPTVVTMAELCVDIGQGRVSSKAAEIQRNHLAWKQQSREKRARMKALAEQKKYGRPEDPDDAPAPATTAAPETPAVAEENAAVVVGSATGEQPAIADASGSGFDYSQELTASRFTVQVRLGPNGETIIDEESLTVDRTEEVDTSNYVHVVESDHTKFVNSQSYTKKLRGSRWSAEETDLFFDALAQHGENYELLSLVLPGRTRTACKNKFKAEDKKDSAKITRLLESRQPIDMSSLGRLTGRDFSGPTPVIKAPTPPPAPDRTMEPEPEPEVTTAHVVRKRSRSRTAKPSSEGVEIIGTADTYDDKD